MSLKLDYQYTTDEGIGDRGLQFQSIEEALLTFRPYYQQIQTAKQAGSLGFLALPYQSDQEIDGIVSLAESVRTEVKNIIIIGIGGSDLGARAVHRALNHQFYNILNTPPRIFFVGDTTDPVALQEVIDVVDFQSCTVVVISKSGNTVEQMSTFLYLRTLLQNAVGDKTRDRIIMVTDPETGTLREIAVQDGYRSLSVPANVGGRFSVFSAVGLFPLALVGINIRELLAGARTLDRHDSEHGAATNTVFLYAVLQYLFYRRGQHISVMMPYAYSLREVGFWFRQLWAESLGKRIDESGNVVEVGPTPVAALGPTDQHSQMQLYMEGPVDKIVTFLEVGQSQVELTVPRSTTEAISYLGGHQFSKILAAERSSSAYALASAGRPSITLTMEKLDPNHVGQLLYFFELAVSYVGSFLEINPFDQPGVELGKKYMYGLLGKKGFEQFSIPEDSHYISSTE